MSRFQWLVDSDEKLWFYKKALPVFDCLELFPFDSIVDAENKPMLPEAAPQKCIFQTDTGWSFSSYILKGGFVIAERSQKRPGVTKWLNEKADLKPPFWIVLEKTGEHQFVLKTESKNHD